jgi:hypothetical protein
MRQVRARPFGGISSALNLQQWHVLDVLTLAGQDEVLADLFALAFNLGP